MNSKNEFIINEFRKLYPEIIMTYKEELLLPSTYWARFDDKSDRPIMIEYATEDEVVEFFNNNCNKYSKDHAVESKKIIF